MSLSTHLSDLRSCLFSSLMIVPLRCEGFKLGRTAKSNSARFNIISGLNAQVRVNRTGDNASRVRNHRKARHSNVGDLVCTRSLRRVRSLECTPYKVGSVT